MSIKHHEAATNYQKKPATHGVRQLLKLQMACVLPTIPFKCPSNRNTTNGANCSWGRRVATKSIGNRVATYPRNEKGKTTPMTSFDISAKTTKNHATPVVSMYYSLLFLPSPAMQAIEGLGYTLVQCDKSEGLESLIKHQADSNMVTQWRELGQVKRTGSLKQTFDRLWN